MSRLPLKHTHIDYNPHVLSSEIDMGSLPDVLLWVDELEHTNAWLVKRIKELEEEIALLRKENSNLHWLDPNNI